MALAPQYREYDDRLKNTSSDGIFSASHKSDAMFNAARLHSHRVRVMKKVLPVLAVLIAVVFSWYTFFATPSFDDLLIVNGQNEDGRLTMIEPKLEGYTSSNRPYSMRAAKAIQDPSQSGIIELRNIDAELPLGNRGQAKVDAKGGIYDNINGRLNLNEPFTVTTNDGMVAKFQSADVNLATSQLSSSKPVDIKRDGQHLKANGMQVRNNGQVLFFHGGVNLLIDNTPPE